MIIEKPLIKATMTTCEDGLNVEVKGKEKEKVTGKKNRNLVTAINRK